MLSCSERTIRSSPAGCRRRLRAPPDPCAAARAALSISSLLIVCRNRSSAFFDISSRRNSHSRRSSPGVRISSADPASRRRLRRARRPRWPASRRSARAAARSASARRRAGRRASRRATAAAVAGPSLALSPAPAWTFASIAARKRGSDDEAGQIGQLAGDDQRQRDVGQRRQRRAGQAAEEEQQVPPEEERLLQVVREPGAAAAASRTDRTGSAVDMMFAMRQSPARVRRLRACRWCRGSRRPGRRTPSRAASPSAADRAAARSISRRIVPGDDEKT